MTHSDIVKLFFIEIHRKYNYYVSYPTILTESTKPWTPIVIERRDKNTETTIDKVLGAATDSAYRIVWREFWQGEDEIEVFCGISDGRTIFLGTRMASLPEQ